MKKFHLLFYYLIIFTLLSCGSVSNYTSNNLNKNYYQNKSIYFTLNPNSKKEVEMSGLYTSTIFDDPYPPNVEDVFKESIEELASETKLNLKYVKNPDNLSGNEILVNTEIINITWHFGFSTATLKTEMKYEIQNESKTFHIEGIRKSGGGSKINNLRKSLKNANYKLLKELEK